MLIPGDMDWRLQDVLRPPPFSAVEDSLEASSEQTVFLVDVIRLKQDRVLAFAIPHATAMLPGASRRAQLRAQKALQHAPGGGRQFHANADAVEFAESLTLSGFAACASLECFANACIPRWLTYKQKGKKHGPSRVLGKEELERSLPPGEKFAVVLPRAFGVVTAKGKAVWESSMKLEKLSNRVLPMQDADRNSGDVEADPVWKALWAISSPHQTAWQLLDHFPCGAPCIPGRAFEKLRPVRPRWHVAWPPEGAIPAGCSDSKR